MGGRGAIGKRLLKADCWTVREADTGDVPKAPTKDLRPSQVLLQLRGAQELGPYLVSPRTAEDVTGSNGQRVLTDPVAELIVRCKVLSGNRGLYVSPEYM